MNNDPWLTRWLPLISERANTQPVLEVGCGWGWDTAVLSQAGLPVLAIDQADLAQAQTAAPQATFQQIDLRDYFPLPADSHSVIIASLSLHYFPWRETERLIADIYNALKPAGILLFRVNSTEDIHYGAAGYPPLEPHFYQVEARTKRFFDAADLARLFGSKWDILSQEKMTIERFHKPKTVWELVLEKGR